jgi:CRISPR-associated protein Csx17
LASYLKALAILRLVSEQADAGARGAWRGDAFVLTSKLDRDELLAFFRERYSPTPVIAPWNGGSGFFPKDNRKALDAILASSDGRLEPYRKAIESAQSVLSKLGIADKPDTELKATVLLPALRSQLPETVLPWLDAAVVLTRTGPKYPPLLGTGGNDGRLDFTNNQMQRVLELLAPANERAQKSTGRLLESALFGTAVEGLASAAIGQFSPAAAGGANAGFGFERDSLTNPWDYVLVIEGSMLFAAAASKRLEGSGEVGLVAPFMVHASGVGYASAAESDPGTSRHELWLPVWERPASLRELRQLLSEGRAKVARRSARSGVDFALAISSLGVDRGIAAFHRYGFHRRNGLAYFATPLGRMRVGAAPDVDLLAPLDVWLQKARRGAASDLAPASIRRAVRLLDTAILDVATRRASGVADILVALGAVDAALSRSKKHEVPPLPALSPAWVERADDNSYEFELAASLASSGMRERMVRWRGIDPFVWQDHTDGRMVWGERSLDGNLVAVVRRREVERAQGDNRVAPMPPRQASLAAIEAFLRREVDDVRLEALLRGLALVTPWPRSSAEAGSSRSVAQCSYAFSIAGLALAREPIPGVELPQTPGLVAKLACGDVAGAVALAARRLRGAGLMPRTSVVHEPSNRGSRIAAALAFPLHGRALADLARRVLVPESKALIPTPN